MSLYTDTVGPTGLIQGRVAGRCEGSHEGRVRLRHLDQWHWDASAIAQMEDSTDVNLGDHATECTPSTLLCSHDRNGTILQTVPKKNLRE